ncbi:MAG: hypothetical protein ACOC6A_02425 [Chloroflexota bacterium]
MATARRLYVGWQWRLVRLAIGACLVALLVSPVELASGGRTALGILAALLIASAVPWTRIPWNEVYANIQLQKLGLEVSGSSLSRLQKERYVNYLSAKVKDVALPEGSEARAVLEVSSQLLWDLSIEELRGCVSLDGTLVSRELRLLGPGSRPRLPRLRPTRLRVAFPLSADALEKLRERRAREEPVHWMFELELKVKFSSGETGVWEAKQLDYAQLPELAS